MATASQLREVIGSVAPELNVYDWQYPYVASPAAIVEHASIIYNGSFSGMHTRRVRITLIAPRMDEQSAQVYLDGILDSEGEVIQALYAIEGVIEISIEQYALHEIGHYSYWGAGLVVQSLA